MEFEEVVNLFKEKSIFNGKKLYDIYESKCFNNTIYFIRVTKNTVIEITTDFLEVSSPALKTYKVESQTYVPLKEIDNIKFFLIPLFEFVIYCSNGITVDICEPFQWDWGFDPKSLKYFSSTEDNQKCPKDK